MPASRKKTKKGLGYISSMSTLGSGVFCEKTFSKGDFLLEYRGELISGEEGTERDKNYPDTKGSFLYFFQHEGNSKCIDGTASDGRGRMVNDSHKNANCKMKVILVEDVPKLCLFAIKDLNEGDELRCDYGVKDLPWRKLEEESNSSLPSHDPPSDSESCDTPCDVGNRHKRRKKSQNSTEMERGVHHLSKGEVVIKVEPLEETQDCFDSNCTNGEGFAFPVIQPSSQEGSSSTFDNTEMVSSLTCTDQSGMGNTKAENVTSIPEIEDLQSFIQNHTDGSQEDGVLKLCSISVPFIQLESNPNSNLAESGQSYEEVDGDFEECTVSSDSEGDGDVDETGWASGIPRPHPESLSDAVPVLKTEPEEDVSRNSGSRDGGDPSTGHQDDSSAAVSSNLVPTGVDTSTKELPGRPRGLKKPRRKCPFCLKFREKLTRHIKHMHKDLRRVQEAMMLPDQQQKVAFGLMRKEGILISNMQKMKETTNPVFERERRSQDHDCPLVICSKCKGFYSEAHFSRHKCEGAIKGENLPIPVSGIGSENLENDDAGSHTHSDDGSCGLCCEEELPTRLSSDDFCYEREHTLVGSDDLVLYLDEGHVYDSNDDLFCEEEGYMSSSEDLCCDKENTLVDNGDDLIMCSEEGHTQASVCDLQSKEGHCSTDSHSKEGRVGSNDSHCEEGRTLVGNDDLCSKEGHSYAWSNDLHSEEGHFQVESDDFCSKEGHSYAWSNDLHCDEGHTQVGSDDLPSKHGHSHVDSDYLHSEEGHTQAGSDDLPSKEVHSHVGSSDSHFEEGHTHGSCDKSHIPKEPPNVSESNNQKVNVEPEANNVQTLSEEWDLDETGRVTETVAISPLTQDSNEPDGTSVENNNKEVTKSSGLNSKCKKPPKKCPFCMEFIKGHLRGHIESAHVDLKQVKDAMDMPEKEQKVAFSLMRKAGILLAQKEKMDQPEQALEREHTARTGGSMVICGGCEGMHPYRSFWRHKIQCQRSFVAASPGPVSCVTSRLEFKEEILDHLPTDEMGDVCRSDPTLLLLGERWWKERLKARRDRSYVKKIVMLEMRTLAIIHRNMKKLCLSHGCGDHGQGHVGDMFHEQKFLSLCEAINTYTRDVESSTERAELKLSLFRLLKKACKVIKSGHVAEGRYNACMEMDSFSAILEQNSDFVFGGSGQGIQSGCSSHEDMTGFFLEGNVSKLRNHILKEMTSLFMDTSLVWRADNFKKLRDMTVLRLTMLNVRRGSEPCRLTVQDFQDGKWNPLSNYQEVGSTIPLVEEELMGNWTTVYQTSLGNDRLVPVCVPADCLQAMVILGSKDKRESVGVPASNPYLFADMEGRLEHHVYGWSALSNICNEAGIHTEAKVRAAENYQWVSLLYTSMELPEPDRISVFEKMGYTCESNDLFVVPELEEMTVDPSQDGKGQKRKQPHKDPEGEPLQTKKKSPDHESQQLYSVNCGKRPKRLCPFCMKAFAGSQLTRHIKHVHKALDEVKHAVRQPNRDRHRYFAQMRKLGLYKQNAQRVMAGSGSLMTLRRTINQKSPAVICKFCKGTYSKLNFRKHKCRPTESKEKSEDESFFQSFLMMKREDPYFTNSVLSTMMHTKTGKACIMDKDILTVGRWIWNTREGKMRWNTKGIRSEVVRAMEHLVVLKVQFEEEMLKCGKEIDGFRTVDMFCVSNFDVLKRSVSSVAAKIEKHAEDRTKEKLVVLIKKAAAILVASLLIQENVGKAKEIEQFLVILEERKNSIASDTEGQTDVSQQAGNGKFEEQLMEKYLAKSRAKRTLEKKEQSSKEGDCISDLFRCHIKLPRTLGTVDACTVNKDKASSSGESGGIITDAKQMPQRKRSKVKNQDYTTIEDSESEQEVAEPKNDKDFSVADTKGREGTGKKQKWSEHATNLIHEHFKSYICTAGEINRGKLPGKEEVKDFLKKNRELLREVKSEDRKVLLVKTKVFNERNNYRRNLLANNENVD
ncbi:N-lysine methyltransferase KMT5A-A [Holothuria leucospilota]|uniref:N-lysine methyltransferase KMT5A-A n=1 Tax=Holothuria leucospilota TaxID=206669 RepID=A0A9Q1HEX7_HOLLE|nr:N-lysine methyltransferase KMT5A-A [Holothuria leucospilota]